MQISKITLIIGIFIILLMSIKTMNAFTTEEQHYCTQNCIRPKSHKDKNADCHKLTYNNKVQYLCHSYCKPGMDCNTDKCVASCPFTKLKA